MVNKLLSLILLFLAISASHAEDFFRKNYVYAVPNCENPSVIRWWIDGPNNKLLLVNLNVSNLQIETFPVLKLLFNDTNLPKGDFAFQYSANSHEILTFYNDGTMRIKEANWNGVLSIVDYHVSKTNLVAPWITCTNNYASKLISSKYVEYSKTAKLSQESPSPKSNNNNCEEIEAMHVKDWMRKGFDFVSSPSYQEWRACVVARIRIHLNKVCNGKPRLTQQQSEWLSSRYRVDISSITLQRVEIRDPSFPNPICVGVFNTLKGVKYCTLNIDINKNIEELENCTEIDN
jgi:hypothetical protein